MHACMMCVCIFILAYSEKLSSVIEKHLVPVIVNVSSDQNLDIVSGHEKVHLKCRITGQNITATYWEKKAADSNSPPTKLNVSKISHHNGLTIISHLTITKPQPTQSGVYCCVVNSQWGMVKSRNVQVNIRSKETDLYLSYSKFCIPYPMQLLHHGLLFSLITNLLWH